MSWAITDTRELGGLAVSAYPSPPQSSSAFSQRRRSSAAHARPAAPPPNLPIPSIPNIPQDPAESTEEVPSTNGFSRPNRSSLFVGTVVQPRLAVQTPSSSSASSSVDDLSDPPPQSILPNSSSRFHEPEHLAIPANDGHLMPPEARTEHRIPSPRRALTQALELAREAVQLDSMNDNPELAVAAYGRSVALLNEVMERVRNGEESTEFTRRRNGRRRSVFAQEEEIRKLQSIHDTYADRMNILSIIYSIQPVPYHSNNIYSPASATPSTSLGSTASTSLTNSPTPSDDIPEHLPVRIFPSDDTPADYQDFPQADEGMTAIGAAMFMRDLASPTGFEISGLPSSGTHPYASAPAVYEDTPPSTAVPPILSNGAARSSIRRLTRTQSNLPPAPPLPSKIPPSAPSSSQSEIAHSNLGPARPRGESVIGHRRTGSGSRLAALEEEEEKYSSSRQSTIRESKSQSSSGHAYDSPPLPALPMPSPPLPDLSGTARPIPPSKLPPSPRPANVSRPRGSSTISTRSDASGIINPTPNQGTIYQRRPKTSGPSTPRSSSPAESTTSAGSIPLPKSVVSSLPGTSSSSSLVTTRSRSSSQPPGRRPSIVNGRISPSEDRPPLPSTANGVFGIPTVPPQRFSKSPLNIQSLTVQTDLTNNSSLAPMSTIAPGVPLTPTSPLPPVPPTDPLRKPYHLMNLLRTTMISTTGGYITRRLHVPQEVWSQGGAKLGNLMEKVRVVDILCTALEDLQGFSSDCFGAGNVSSGMALGIGSIGRKEGEAWIAKLEDFSTVCDGVVANFGKKLGVGEGFVIKKTTWGDKLGRRFDKLTNGKNLDSPAAYVQGLKKLFLHAQLLDEHTQAITSTPVAPAYGALPAEIRSAADLKLKRSSEFFASVVLTFVIRDLSMLLDKYAKKCEKWLAE
ncbi:hypothetical protein GGU10DRAFT_303319 [Lentinula aff. detonsa]|uniref:MIT domain-containing protein n=1 Tax=Lentinula aff. detonsa TaxID=2804958 RepID=A0AA38NSE7_9AGAR|nr:hypothetical protein GGU10DRAFT_303319 [Lentinula aff. detonsa]